MGHGRAPAATQPGAVGSHHHPRATNPVCHHLATLPGRCQGWRWPLVAVPSPTLPHHPSPAVPRLVPRAQVGNARQVAAWHSSGASGSPWLTLSSLSARRVPTCLRTAPSCLAATMAISSRLALWEQKESLGPGWHWWCFGAGWGLSAGGVSLQQPPGSHPRSSLCTSLCCDPPGSGLLHSLSALV